MSNTLQSALDNKSMPSEKDLLEKKSFLLHLSESYTYKIQHLINNYADSRMEKIKALKQEYLLRIKEFNSSNLMEFIIVKFLELDHKQEEINSNQDLSEIKKFINHLIEKSDQPKLVEKFVKLYDQSVNFDNYINCLIESLKNNVEQLTNATSESVSVINKEIVEQYDSIRISKNMKFDLFDNEIEVIRNQTKQNYNDIIERTFNKFFFNSNLDASTLLNFITDEVKFQDYNLFISSLNLNDDNKKTLEELENNIVEYSSAAYLNLVSEICVLRDEVNQAQVDYEKALKGYEYDEASNDGEIQAEDVLPKDSQDQDMDFAGNIPEGS